LEKVWSALPGLGACQPHFVAALCLLSKKSVISLRSMLFLMPLQMSVSKMSVSSKMELPLSFIPLTFPPSLVEVTLTSVRKRAMISLTVQADKEQCEAPKQLVRASSEVMRGVCQAVYGTRRKSPMCMAPVPLPSGA
jgi:hypothetical protein